MDNVVFSLVRVVFSQLLEFILRRAATVERRQSNIVSDSGAISENCISEFACAFDSDKLVCDLIAVLPAKTTRHHRPFSFHEDAEALIHRTEFRQAVVNSLRKMTIKMCLNWTASKKRVFHALLSVT